MCMGKFFKWLKTSDICVLTDTHLQEQIWLINIDFFFMDLNDF